MTYIVSGGALNSTHSLTAVHELMAFGEKSTVTRTDTAYNLCEGVKLNQLIG